MPSLREMMLQKQAEEAARQDSKVTPHEELVPEIPWPPKRQEPDVPTEREPGPVETVVQVKKTITIDTLRGLYWMATDEHVGDKKMPRGQLKRKLNALLLSKDGMRAFLKSLEQFVFS